MANIPYVIIKCAMSMDGYIDDNSDKRLVLSDVKDFERVDAVRAECDAILIGAETVRKDNPKILIKSAELRKNRLLKGMSENPMKITMTTSGMLSKDLRFFTNGNSEKIVYCGDRASEQLALHLAEVAEVVSSPHSRVEPEFILQDLNKRGIKKLMIEGGSGILTMFLSSGLVDELQVSVAPFFVGEINAPRFVNAGAFVHDKDHRMKLENVEMIGDMALLTYKLSKKI